MFLRSCAFGLATIAVASVTWALPNGIATSACNGCHTADVEYDGTLSLIANGELAPGVATEFTLRIEESHMKSAGFFVYGNHTGTFAAGTGNRASAEGIVHSRPVTATDGVVEIEFSWTPPVEADGLDMWVYVVAADNSSSQTGDIAVSATFPLVWGCEGITLYEDIDGDGYGNKQGARSIGCAAREGWATNDADCNDLWISIYPGAKEVANNKDDDCNDEVDDGVVVGTWYADADGDGYGELGTEVEGETATEGYVANSDDCNDSDATVSPEGIEVCDGFDNDCNRLIDDGDGVYVICGVGICSRRWETCDSECVPGAPMPEGCNGLDDDCDGEVDEEVTCLDGSPCEAGACSIAPAASATTVSEPGVTSSGQTPFNDAATDPSQSIARSPNGSLADAGQHSSEMTGPDASDKDPAAPEETEASPRAPSPSGSCALSGGQNACWPWFALACATLAWRRTRRTTRPPRALSPAR